MSEWRTPNGRRMKVVQVRTPYKKKCVLVTRLSSYPQGQWDEQDPNNWGHQLMLRIAQLDAELETAEKTVEEAEA